MGLEPQLRLFVARVAEALARQGLTQRVQPLAELYDPRQGPQEGVTLRAQDQARAGQQALRDLLRGAVPGAREQAREREAQRAGEVESAARRAMCGWKRAGRRSASSPP